MKVKALLSIILVVFITFTGCDSATPLSEKEDDAVNLKNRRTDIHLSQLKYEFDEETGKGAGLRLDTVDQEECFI